MTVRELIERLNALNPDAVVMVKRPGYDGDWSWEPADTVEDGGVQSIEVYDPEPAPYGRWVFRDFPTVDIYYE
jgi:hypothetical protein